MKIIDLKTRIIDSNITDKIYDMVSSSESAIALDLSNVEDCVTKFFEVFRRFNKKVTLVNVDSKILAALYMTGYDRYVRVFEDKLSLESDRNEIIKRRFSVV